MWFVPAPDRMDRSLSIKYTGLASGGLQNTVFYDDGRQSEMILKHRRSIVIEFLVSCGDQFRIRLVFCSLSGGSGSTYR